MDPIELISQYEAQDFDYWMDFMLDEVSDDVDKRQGSVIYDAMAPAATALAERSLTIANLLRQTHISTADNENLDYHAADKGMARQT